MFRFLLCRPALGGIRRLIPGLCLAVDLPLKGLHSVLVTAVDKGLERLGNGVGGRVVGVLVVFDPVGGDVASCGAGGGAGLDVGPGAAKPKIADIVGRHGLPHEDLCLAVDLVKDLVRHVHPRPGAPGVTPGGGVRRAVPEIPGVLCLLLRRPSLGGIRRLVPSLRLAVDLPLQGFYGVGKVALKEVLQLLVGILACGTDGDAQRFAAAALHEIFVVNFLLKLRAQICRRLRADCPGYGHDLVNHAFDGNQVARICSGVD